MKKIKFAIVFGCLAASIAMESCSKKEAVVSPLSQTTNSHNTMKSGDDHVAWVTHDECSGAGRACSVGGPIVLHPVAFSMMAAAEASGNSGTVGATFGDQDLDEVIDGMDAADVIKLQSGNYYITLNYESGTVINYMVGTTYPVTGQNMDFAFQVEK